MSSKTLASGTARGNTNGHGRETSYENPTIGSSSSQRSESSSGGSETEIEDVEGYNIFKPGESDKEVSNGRESEAFELEGATSLEEPGTSISGTEVLSVWQS